MRRMDLRELNQYPSRAIEAVRQGTTVELTDRGRPIAHLIPVANDEAVAQLVASGRARPATALGAPALPPEIGDPSVSAADALAAEREAERW